MGDGDCLAPPIGLVLAGGEGRRMAAAHPEIPKPLLRVAGTSLLEWNLRRLASAGANPVFVAIGHRSEAIAAAVREMQPRISAEISILEEQKPLGTIGAVSRLNSADRAICAVNGDLLSTMPLRPMMLFHRERRSELTVATHMEAHQIHFGEVETGDGARIVRYVEKPLKSYRLSSGMYIIGPRVAALIGDEETLGFPDLARRALNAGAAVYAYDHQYPWLDVNDAETLRRAEDWVRDSGGVDALVHGRSGGA